MDPTTTSNTKNIFTCMLVVAVQNPHLLGNVFRLRNASQHAPLMIARDRKTTFQTLQFVQQVKTRLRTCHRVKTGPNKLLAFNSMCDIHVLSNHRTQSAEFTLSLVHNADNSMARKQKQRTPKLCKRLFSSAQALEAPENFKLRPRETNSKSGSTLVLGPTFLPASLGTNMSGKNRRAT